MMMTMLDKRFSTYYQLLATRRRQSHLKIFIENFHNKILSQNYDVIFKNTKRRGVTLFLERMLLTKVLSKIDLQLQWLVRLVVAPQGHPLPQADPIHPILMLEILLSKSIGPFRICHGHRKLHHEK